MRLLELFSWFGHVSGHFREHGWEALTLDYAKHFNADICIDILQWDYTVYPRDYFDANISVQMLCIIKCERFPSVLAEMSREVAEPNEQFEQPHLFIVPTNNNT